MSLGDNSWASRYAAMNQEELLALARDYDSLNDDAQAALRAEFAVRGMEAPLVEDPDQLAEELVTIRRYRDLSEAIVARSLLESAGIRVELRDENLIRLDWQVSNFIGGIRLQVEPEDAATATELLDQPVPETIPFAGPFDASDPEFQQPHCPRCGSLEITFEGASRGAALTSLYVLGIPMPTGAKSWFCANCGNRWEEPVSL